MWSSWDLGLSPTRWHALDAYSRSSIWHWTSQPLSWVMRLASSGGLDLGIALKSGALQHFWESLFGHKRMHWEGKFVADVLELINRDKSGWFCKSILQANPTVLKSGQFYKSDQFCRDKSGLWVFSPVCASIAARLWKLYKPASLLREVMTC